MYVLETYPCFDRDTCCSLSFLCKDEKRQRQDKPWSHSKLCAFSARLQYKCTTTDLKLYTQMQHNRWWSCWNHRHYSAASVCTLVNCSQILRCIRIKLASVSSQNTSSAFVSLAVTTYYSLREVQPAITFVQRQTDGLCPCRFLWDYI